MFHPKIATLSPRHIAEFTHHLCYIVNNANGFIAIALSEMMSKFILYLLLKFINIHRRISFHGYIIAFPLYCRFPRLPHSISNFPLEVKGDYTLVISQTQKARVVKENVKKCVKKSSVQKHGKGDLPPRKAALPPFVELS